MLVSLLCFSLSGAALATERTDEVVKLKVTATAYNSLPGQTVGNPSIGAWGHRLKPGMKAIAVSRDLLAMGLEPGAEVTIEGLPGRYKVLDKMGSRWRKKIDIYMGVDRDAALEWGRRPVVIRFNSENS
ncbi:lipoprotein [Marinobacterium nitratireducens]|uniref:Lipoprotein n=1 Tax=Marinobacterium nitratireducens TaxID=518897 RepID=A0A917Z6U9_9GAMM|nr:lipoprotein [Marinobacterium nitratireducens]